MRFLILVWFSLASLSIGSQNVVFSGKVISEGKQPVEGANVALQGTTCGTTTNAKGGFEFSCAAKFPAKVVVSMIGYATVEKDLKSASEARDLTIIMNVTNQQLERVDVTGQKQQTSFQKLDARHARVVVDASGGIESLLKTQMGVSSNSELSSQYRVRGGNFDENMVYVNNTEIYRPFLIRSGEQEGLSFVNPDLVESLEFSSGGFDASYGDRMSSVLDVKYKKPQETAGSLSAGLLGASGHLEGSAFKGKFTHVTGARYKTNQYLLGSLDMKGDYAPSFFDVQSYLTFKANDELSFDFMGYYAQNRYHFVPQNRETSFGTVSEVKKLKVYFEGEEDDRYQTGLFTGAINYRPSEQNLFRFSGGTYRSFEEESYDILGEYWLQEVLGGEGQSDDLVEDIGVGGYLQHARNELLGVVSHLSLMGNHFFDRHIIRWELKYQHESFDDYLNEWEMRDSAGYSVPGNSDGLKLAYAYNAQLHIQSNRFSGYAKDDMFFDLPNGKLNLNYGIRAAYWDFNREWIVSPRLNLSYVPAANPQSRYRFATGLYYQAPFYREIRTPSGEVNRDIESQQSFQILLATDRFFSWGDQPFKFTAEAYYKNLSKLIPYQIDNVRIRYSGENNAHGYATGLDLKLNGEFVPGVESWAGISLMRTAEDIENDAYTIQDDQGNTVTVHPGYIPRPSDQRINFSLFFQDYLPNNPSLRVHLNMLYGTGLPFGPPKSERYKAVNRMPAYRRVDMGLSKDLLGLLNGNTSSSQSGFFKSAWVELEIFNLFNFSNTISYFWVTDVENRQYAVPNYLTSRRFNLKLSVTF
ncbi:MAG: TonB-dependent receptor [Breznakibacter sp.]